MCLRMNAKVRGTRIRCGECNGRKTCRVIVHLWETGVRVSCNVQIVKSAYRSDEHEVQGEKKLCVRCM